MYKFSVYEFSNKEIDQICDLYLKYTSGQLLPIDRRRYTKQVLQYAKNWNLLIEGIDSRYEQAKPGRLYLNDNPLRRYEARHDLPPEALYRLVKRIFKTYPNYGECNTLGYSISKRIEWTSLNIWPEGHKFQTDQDWQDMVGILDTLARFGYIIFQRAGTIWCITETLDRAVRSE